MNQIPRNAVSAAARIGIDVGGTFTDVVLVAEDGAKLRVTKVPSTPTAPAAAMIDGVERVLKMAEATPEEVLQLSHGTTLATNLLITGRGKRVGLLVTEGFRDVIYLGRLRFPDPNNVNGAANAHLVRPRQVREVPERLGPVGEVRKRLDEAAVIEAVAELVEKEKIESLAIGFLHAYRNPEHELAAKRLVAERWPDLPVCCSSEVWARPREYERWLVSAMNAYVTAPVRDYLEAFESSMRERKLRTAPLVTRSNGGVMSIGAAATFPVHTMLSGPSAGLAGAIHFARQGGCGRIVTWDMGGTSLDVGVVDQTVSYSDEGRVGDFPLFVRTVDVKSIGAGGGSIGWVSPSGMLEVGPESAGADPGPACYGRGGRQPTITDAYLALGILDAGYFAGGEIKLDVELARTALAELGGKLGLDTAETAEAMLQVATAQMQTKFMPLLARRGVDPREFVLVPYGGAGPTHAFIFAEAAGFSKVLVPPIPGLLCARGAMVADVRYDVPVSVLESLDRLDEAHFNARLRQVETQVLDWVNAQGVALAGTSINCVAQARYKGQSFEVDIPLPAGLIRRQMVSEAFLKAYHDRYGYSEKDLEVELVAVIVQGVGNTVKPPALQTLPSTPGQPATSREVRFGGQARSVRVIRRETLSEGDSFEGPAVVTQADTTTFVTPGFHVTVDAALNLVGEYRK